MKITSLNNPKVKEWSHLLEKKYRDTTNLFLIEGDHLFNEAMKKNLVVEIISDDTSFNIPGIPFYEVTKEILKKLSRQKSGTNLIAVVKKLDNSKITGNICLLDNIQDPGNLGGIIRSAHAFNIKTIIMSENTVDLYNDKVIRSSEGMIFHLNFLKTNLSEIIVKLKKEGYHIYGTDVTKGTNLKSISFSQYSGIIIGNEGKGMSPDLIPLCDEMINIPLNKSCESLNASIAASIIFYKMTENA